MRPQVLALVFLGLHLLGTATNSAETVVLYRVRGVTGLEGSMESGDFEVPTGLKSLTLHLSSTLYGRVLANAHFGTTETGGTGTETIRPTVAYPEAGEWQVTVEGVRAYGGLTVTVTGEPDPYPLSRQAGSFRAINGADAVDFTMIFSGAFTAKYYQAGVPFAFHGKFDAAGDASSNSPVPYSLHIDPTFNPTLGANVISGTVSGESFTAYHAAYKSTSKAQETGTYTALLTPAQTGATLPPGAGFGSMVVRRTGSVTLVGRLPDGTLLSTGGVLTGSGGTDNQFLLYDRALNAQKGLVGGVLVFESETTSDFDGTLRWIKPATKSAYDSAAFDTDLNTVGNHYGPRARGICDLDFTGNSPNATLTLSGGGLATTITEPVTLDLHNVVTIDSANTNQVRLVFDVAQGKFTGSFLHPVSGKRISFSGALYQNTTAPKAAGYFLGPVVDGTGFGGNVTLVPQ